jgi:hypothetical protein
MPSLLEILEAGLELFKRKQATPPTREEPVKQERETADPIELASPDEELEDDEIPSPTETDKDGIHIINPKLHQQRQRKKNESAIEAIEEEDSIPDMEMVDNKKYCRTVPFDKRPRVVPPDDKTTGIADIEIDKKLRSEASIKKRTEINRRPKYQKVKARCRMCRQLYKVDPAFIPGKVAADDTASFICDHCIPKR